MENIEKFSFQLDSEVIKIARNLNNYKIIFDDTQHQGSPICAVYFSSNYIYYPNNDSSVTKSIIEKDRYEWWSLRYPSASKHIFIRDIYKQWYLHGINNNINSIEKMCEFLKSELSGYESIFIGSSAGGYAAVLIGSILDIKKVYAFNNQFFLTDLLEKSNPIIDPLLFREKTNGEINKYYNIKKYITKPQKIFYFHSNKSEWDIRQYNQVKNLKLNVISVNTSIHGIPILKNNLIELFKLNNEMLTELSKRELNPLGFSLNIIGFNKTIIFMIRMVPSAYMRFIHNPIRRKFRK